jgi:hypothetical protein
MFIALICVLLSIQNYLTRPSNPGTAGFSDQAIAGRLNVDSERHAARREM